MPDLFAVMEEKRKVDRSKLETEARLSALLCNLNGDGKKTFTQDDFLAPEKVVSDEREKDLISQYNEQQSARRLANKAKAEGAQPTSEA